MTHSVIDPLSGLPAGTNFFAWNNQTQDQVGSGGFTTISPDKVWAEGGLGTGFNLTIDGLNGGSGDANHEGAFDVDGFNFDMKPDSDQTPVLSGGQDFETFTVSFQDDQSLAAFMARMATGADLGTMQFESSAGRRNTQVVFDATFTDVRVVAVQDNTGAGFEVTFAFAACDFATFDLKGAIISHKGWNYLTNS